MAGYIWGMEVNGLAGVPVTVAKGERVELVMRNTTMMSHPMHLHGHSFQVTEINGQSFPGAMRDTVLVTPRSTVKVVLRCRQSRPVGLPLPQPLSHGGRHVHDAGLSRLQLTRVLPQRHERTRPAHAPDPSPAAGTPAIAVTRLLVIDLARPLLVERCVARIGADDQKIAARLDAAVAGAGGKDDDVARLDRQYLSLGAAEFHGGAAARDAQHLVRGGVEMQEGMDAVAPAVAPAVLAESALERRRRIRRSPARPRRRDRPPAADAGCSASRRHPRTGRLRTSGIARSSFGNLRNAGALPWNAQSSPGKAHGPPSIHAGRQFGAGDAGRRPGPRPVAGPCTRLAAAVFQARSVPARGSGALPEPGHRRGGLGGRPHFRQFPALDGGQPRFGRGSRPRWHAETLPDEEWNSWRNAQATTRTARDHFVCVQSVVADNRGNLWVLDPASPGNEKVIAGGPKLVRIELATNKVAQVIHFGEDVALQGSYLNDVRFHPDGNTAFITDSGARGAIVVVDLESGRAHARLDGHPSTQPEKGVEISVDGQKLQRPDGRGFRSPPTALRCRSTGRRSIGRR